MSKIERIPRYSVPNKTSKPYLARTPQSISMVVDGQETLKVTASFSPVGFADGAEGSSVMDHWDVTLKNPVTEAEMTTSFSAGTGLRVFSDRAGMKTPVHPLLSDVIGCMGVDADTYAELPKRDDAALEYLRFELGYETVPEARTILDAICVGYEKLEGFLKNSGASVEDFVAWSHSEQVEGYGTLNKGEFLVLLPEIAGENNVTYKGALRVGLSPVKGGSGLTTALEPRADNALRLSVVASVWRREEGAKFFSFQSSGSSMETVNEHWADVPEVLVATELAERWHLNDMNAGTDSQNESLHKRFDALPDYEKFKAFLAEDGLLTDRGYTYGSKWLLETLPDEVVDTVHSWRDNGLLLSKDVAVIPTP